MFYHKLLICNTCSSAEGPDHFQTKPWPGYQEAGGEGGEVSVSQYKEGTGLGQEEDLIQLPSVPVRRPKPREPRVTVALGV